MPWSIDWTASGLIGSHFSGSSLPFSRISGGRIGLMCRSDACCSTMKRSRLSIDSFSRSIVLLTVFTQAGRTGAVFEHGAGPWESQFDGLTRIPGWA